MLPPDSLGHLTRRAPLHSLPPEYLSLALPPFISPEVYSHFHFPCEFRVEQFHLNLYCPYPGLGFSGIPAFSCWLPETTYDYSPEVF